jgi:hypothetical protein
VQRFASVALFVAALAVAPAGYAQDDPSRTAAARALFEEGMRAVDSREWERAVDRLSRSLELRASPVVRFNLGLALIEIGRFVEASEHFRSVQRETEAGSDAHRLSSERLRAIEGRIGRLRIEVTGARESVEVQLDGRAVPQALVGVASPADPGERRVSLHRAGEEVASSSVTVASGELAVVTIDAPPPPAGEPDDARPDPLRDTTPVASGGVEQEWWFWTLMAVLVVGAAVGIGAGVAVATETPFLEGDDGFTHHTLLEFP